MGDSERRNAVSRCMEAIRSDRFPCVGAKAALAGHNIEFVVAGDLRADRYDDGIVAALQRFHPNEFREYASLLVLFPATPDLTEDQFETYLWQRLQSFHDIDRRRHAWDAAVSADPASPDFGFSIGGRAFFVVGMHPGAGRLGRRMPFPVMAFNSHELFRHLRASGVYGRVERATRLRDMALQGNLNPMLAEHGTKSEASQYSGRRLPEAWVCPFRRPDGG